MGIIGAVKRAKAGAKAKSGPVRTGPPTPRNPAGGGGAQSRKNMRASQKMRK
jgi:hypothetical protein